jgi:hypothetical protein
LISLKIFFTNFILVGSNEVLGSSLFIVGEIGGNDYGFPLFEKNAFEELITGPG